MTVRKVDGDDADSPNTYYIDWYSKQIPYGVYQQVYMILDTSTDYGPVTPEKMTRLADLASMTNKRHGTSITVEQVTSLRNLVVHHKVITGYGRMNGLMPRIAAAYRQAKRNSKTILDISAQFNLPPKNTLRGIFLHLKEHSPRDIMIMFSTGDVSKLSEFDQEQYKLADANDAENIIVQQAIAEKAAVAENTFLDYIASYGIGFRDQNDLVAEQVEQYGRAIATPDILFTDVVYLRCSPTDPYTPCYWIDYKDYMGTNIALIRSNIKQATNYNQQFGPGAFAYRHSYIEGLYPEAMCVDAGFIFIPSE